MYAIRRSTNRLLHSPAKTIAKLVGISEKSLLQQLSKGGILWFPEWVVIHENHEYEHIGPDSYVIVCHVEEDNRSEQCRLSYAAKRYFQIEPVSMARAMKFTHRYQRGEWIAFLWK